MPKPIKVQYSVNDSENGAKALESDWEYFPSSNCDQYDKAY